MPRLAPGARERGEGCGGERAERESEGDKSGNAGSFRLNDFDPPPRHLPPTEFPHKLVQCVAHVIRYPDVSKTKEDCAVSTQKTPEK